MKRFLIFLLPILLLLLITIPSLFLYNNYLLGKPTLTNTEMSFIENFNTFNIFSETEINSGDDLDLLLPVIDEITSQLYQGEFSIGKIKNLSTDNIDIEVTTTENSEETTNINTYNLGEDFIIMCAQEEKYNVDGETFYKSEILADYVSDTSVFNSVIQSDVILKSKKIDILSYLNFEKNVLFTVYEEDNSIDWIYIYKDSCEGIYYD